MSYISVCVCGLFGCVMVACTIIMQSYMVSISISTTSYYGNLIELTIVRCVIVIVVVVVVVVVVVLMWTCFAFQV